MSLVLVVDDESSIRHAITLLLRTRGYSVVTASSCDEALTACRENLPSLIITDINMPGRSGFDLLAELQAAHLWKVVPLVFVSALAGAADIARGMSAGARDYITKPFNPGQLLDRVSMQVAP